MKKLFIIFLLVFVSTLSWGQISSDSLLADTTSYVDMELAKAKSKTYSYLNKCSVYAIKKECKDKATEYANVLNDYQSLIENNFAEHLEEILSISNDSPLYELKKEYLDATKRINNWTNDGHEPAYVIGTLYHYVNHYNGKVRTQKLVNYAIEFCKDIDIEIILTQNAIDTTSSLLESLDTNY